MGLDFGIRDATKADRDWVLTCRNHATIRGRSSSFKFISEEEHKEWWATSNRIKLIFTFNGKSAGFVTLAPDPQVEDYFIWSFWLNPYTFHPPGTGSIMLNIAFYYLKLYYPFVRNMFGYVKKDNIASIKLHKKLGFIEQLSIDREDYRLFRRKI